MDIVNKHLRLWAQTAFIPSFSDCSIVLADYVLDVTGRDGAAHLRGRYASLDECDALTGYRGGLIGVVADCCSRARLCRTDEPVRGDIGITRLRHLEFGGLCLGDRWAVKSPDGVLFLRRMDLIAAWAVRG